MPLHSMRMNVCMTHDEDPHLPSSSFHPKERVIKVVEFTSFNGWEFLQSYLKVRERWNCLSLSSREDTNKIRWNSKLFWTKKSNCSLLTVKLEPFSPESTLGYELQATDLYGMQYNLASDFTVILYLIYILCRMKKKLILEEVCHESAHRKEGRRENRPKLA